MKEKDVLLEKLQSEKSQHSSAIEQLTEELAAQRLKNDVSIVVSFKTLWHAWLESILIFLVATQDLRTKNWKAMEAVSSAEKNLEAKKKECERLTRVSAHS